MPASGAVTITAWIKPTTVLSSKNSIGIIEDRGGSLNSPNNNVDYSFGIQGSGLGTQGVLSEANSNGSSYAVPADTYVRSPNVWQFVAFTENSSDHYQFYVNGIPTGTGTASIGIQSFSGDTFTLGTSKDTADNDFYSGALDDVRVYNRALSAQEIAQLYAVGAGVNIAHSNTSTNVGLNSGLVGYWTFDGPTINWATDGVQDKSGSGNNGLMVGMSTTTSPVIGKIGQALSFNGISSYVDIPMTFTPAQMTVSIWFKANSLTGDNPRFVANGHTDADDKGFQLMVNGGTNNGFFDVGNGSTACTANWSVPLLSTGIWYQYVGVYTGTAAYAYINGQLVGSATGCSGSIASDGDDINIGRNPNYTGDYVNGAIDDVRLYTRALSAQEVQQLYLMGK